MNVTRSHELLSHHSRRLRTRTSSRPAIGTSATLDTGRECTRVESNPQSGQCPTGSTGSTSTHRPTRSSWASSTRYPGRLNNTVAASRGLS